MVITIWASSPGTKNNFVVLLPLCVNDSRAGSLRTSRTVNLPSESVNVSFPVVAPSMERSLTLTPSTGSPPESFPVLAEITMPDTSEYSSVESSVSERISSGFPDTSRIPNCTPRRLPMMIKIAPAILVDGSSEMSSMKYSRSIPPSKSSSAMYLPNDGSP